MKTKLFFSLFVIVFSATLNAQTVNEVWTDFGGFWNSSSTNQNTIQPNNTHHILAFRYGSTIYSTNVNNQILDDNDVTGYTQVEFRALPISTLPTTGSTSYFVGLGAEFDGIPIGVNSSSTQPFAAITNGSEVADFLTRGIKGLDLGSCLTNIPSGTTAEFNLSSAGITVGNIGDGVPDLLVSQIAQPTTTGVDQLRFVDASGVTVGNAISINLSNNTNFPALGQWTADFYQFNSQQPQSNFINTSRDIRFFAADLSAFGITALNAGNAVKLIYTPGGSSDPAFLAFNEPSLGVASQIAILTKPTTSNCDGTLPSTITVQLEDSNGNSVSQAGLQITASMATGPGELLGTTTRTTNSSGVATFNDLQFEVGGNHTIRFEFSSLSSVVTTNIAAATGCTPTTPVEWTGNTDSMWNKASNWTPPTIPNANYDVLIPAGRPNYPILQSNAGARNIEFGNGASIVVNGFTFAITGAIKTATNNTINASAANSELYYSGTSKQFMQGSLFTDGIANLIIENPGGLDVETDIEITETLQLLDGNLAVTTGNTISMICRFSPRETAIIGESQGTITGNFITEQCFPARRAFRLISPSLNTSTSIRANWQEGASAWNNNPLSGYGTHITGLGQANPEAVGDGTNGFDWQPSGNPSLFEYDNVTPSNGWSPIANTNVNTLSAGTPYRIMIRGDRGIDIRFNNATPTDTRLRETGTVSNATVSFNNPNFSSTIADYILIGNPYQSIVDLLQVYSRSTNIAPYAVYWDPTLGGIPTVGESGGRGAYAVVDLLQNINSLSSSSANKFLEPKQAVLFQANGDGTPVITFEESHKVLDEVQKQTFSLPRASLRINLYDENSFTQESTPDDGLRIQFDEFGNNDLDIYDAGKFDNIDENLARIVDFNLVSMEKRALPVHNEELSLFTSNYRSLNYVFQIERINFPENINIYLIDHYTQEEHLIQNEESTIYFDVDPNINISQSTMRFELRFEYENLSTITQFEDQVFMVYPNPIQNNQLWINLPETISEDSKIWVYNLLGQKLKSFNINEDRVQDNKLLIDNFNLQAGTYILQLQTEVSTYSTKIIVK